MLFLLFILLNTPFTLSCTLSTGVIKTNPGEGDLCAECSYQGYYLGTTCYCILPSFDPNNFCLPVVETYYENITTYNTSFAECTCYENWENGFFKLSTPPKKYINGEKEFVYGELEFPPICDDCYSELYGPNPREMTASRLVLGGLKPCTQYGGPDPNLIPTFSPVSSRVLLDQEYRAWRACNNHGRWNSTLKGCQCDLGWGLNYIGDGYNGEVFSCNRCIGPWGPPTPEYQDAIQNIPFAVFCSVPWTPDPEDGELKECSGHGVFLNGGCVCEGNWALGVYNLTQETIILNGVESYTNQDVVYSVLTCITCKDGYKVEEGCGTFRTRSPTSIPSRNPTVLPSKNPTKTPTVNPSKTPTLNPTKNPSRNPTLNPTRNPTLNPTLNPSRNPTKNPTSAPSKNPSKTPTKNPTRNPTAYIGSLRLYNANILSQGNIGSRAATTTTCRNRANTLGLNCVHTPMLLTYTTSQIVDFPSIYLFSPSTPLYNSVGLKLADSWTQAVSGTGLRYTLVNGGVFPSGTTSFWTGGYTFVNIVNNCNDWTSNVGFGMTFPYVGSATTTSNLWVRSTTTSSCINSFRAACLCASGEDLTDFPTKNPTMNPTKNPTKNPTLKPTLNPSHNPTLTPTKPPTKNPSLTPTLNPTTNPTLAPTLNPSLNPTLTPTLNPTLDPTSNPTINPSKTPSENPTSNPTRNPTEFVGSLKFYKNPFANNGNKGGKGLMDTQCASEASSLGLDCIFTTALLSTSSALVSDFPVKYAFSPTTPVYSGTNVKLANSWDDAFTGSGLLLPLYPTVFDFLPGGQNWGMGNFTGAPLAEYFCNDWTVGTSAFSYAVGEMLSTTVPAWFNSYFITCDESAFSLCLCTSPEVVTSSPTKNPTTREPTTNPTKSPSVNPTRNPSKNPSKNPTRNPTKNPTKNPTRKPTRDPTKNPTKNPTKRPTKDPTKNPTRNPTRNPSKNPTRNPTRNPSKNPSKNPTKNPTKKPTSDPTKNPTKNPTVYQCLQNSVTECVISVECDCGYDCVR